MSLTTFQSLISAGIPAALPDTTPLDPSVAHAPRRVIEGVLSETDRTKRMELYRKAEQIAMNDAPMMILQYDEDWRLLQKYVEGDVTNAMDKRMYKFVWFNPAKMQ